LLVVRFWRASGILKEISKVLSTVNKKGLGYFKPFFYCLLKVKIRPHVL